MIIRHVLLLGEIIAAKDFYDYTAKYADNKTEMVIPADVTQSQYEAISKWPLLHLNHWIVLDLFALISF